MEITDKQLKCLCSLIAFYRERDYIWGETLKIDTTHLACCGQIDVIATRNSIEEILTVQPSGDIHASRRDLLRDIG